MYILSYEKCVCFIFLVILAILSCSGFRIDSLAMTDISKRNSHTSSSSLNSRDFFDRLFSRNAPSAPQEPQRYHHKIRHHHRQLRSQPASERRVTYRSNQPPIDRSVKEKNRQKKGRTTCQKQDAARKAYLANTVVLARAESMSSNRVHNYSVSFKILQKIKNTFAPIDDRIRLSFSSESKNIDCALEETSRSHGLVKAKIRQSEEYLLFLNTYGAHNYSVFGTPIRVNYHRKRKLMHKIKKAINPRFDPRRPKVVSLTPTRTANRKIRIECVTKGFPNPYIYWKKDGSILHSSSRLRITYKKQKTTLVIKNVQDSDQGRYECVAQLKGNDSKHWDFDPRITIPNSEKSKHGEDCEESYRDTLCQNGGTCFYIAHLKERSCVCPEGFHGQTCALKTISNQSSMYGNPKYTCTLGLSTKYYC